MGTLNILGVLDANLMASVFASEIITKESVLLGNLSRALLISFTSRLWSFYIKKHQAAERKI